MKKNYIIPEMVKHAPLRQITGSGGYYYGGGGSYTYYYYYYW